MHIPLSKPDITKREVESVTSVLATPYLSMGPKTVEFERKLARFIGVKHAVAVNSGTAALHLALKSIAVDRDDEVITTPFSFVASANAILYMDAKPRFIDIRLEDLTLDHELVNEFISKKCCLDEKTGVLINKYTHHTVRVILPVHIFGQACDMKSILGLAENYHLKIVEDACEALGTSYHHQKTGSFGSAGTFAFYPNKQITTGEGGAIVTNDEQIDQLCRCYRNQGRSQSDQWLIHERLGYNYRLSDINCALGIAQLERIDEIIAKRESVVEAYYEVLKDIDEIIIPQPCKHGDKSWFVYVIQLKQNFSMNDRNQIMSGLKAHGVECRNYFSPIHLQPFYRKLFGYRAGDFPITESVSERTIAIPFYNTLSQEEINYIAARLVKEIRKILNKHRIIIQQIEQSCDLTPELNEL